MTSLEEVIRMPDETVRFELDGDHYEITVPSEEATKLRALVAEYAKAGRRRKGRPRVGAIAARVPASGRLRSKQSILTLPVDLVAAVDEERAQMRGMDRADLYRRIFAQELVVPGGPEAWWGRRVRRGRRAAGAGRVETRRVSLALAAGQEDALRARAELLSRLEGAEVTVNELAGRLLARWLARRNQ